MLIRKNSFANLQNSPQSSPQKLIYKPLNYSRQSQFSNLNNQSQHEGLSYEELMKKNQKQELQIQKLTKIIDSYKCKVSQFSQYEQVLQQYINSKKQQKVKPVEIKLKPKNNKFQIVQTVSRMIKPINQDTDKCIIHVMNVKIVPKIENNFNQQQKQQYQSKTWSSHTSSQSFVQKINLKQPQQKTQLIQKQPVKSYFAPKYSQRDFNESFLFTQEKENFNVSQNQSVNGENHKGVQRIPSLQNMRRMQKCFKLLNS